MNLTELLDAAALRFPTKAAVIDGATVVTYANLVARTHELANPTIRAGQRIGISLPNSADYIAATYAVWRAGAIAVPVPVECSAEERSHIITSLGLAGIITPTGFEKFSGVPVADNHNLNIAFIRFTSGTTNTSKGVVVTHETIRDRITAANKALAITAADTIVWILPMAHHFLVTIVLYLSQGATIVLVHSPLARNILEAVQRTGATILYAAPMHYAWLARDKSELSLATIRLAISTTCALTQDVAETFEKRYRLPLRQALGIIELGLVCLNTDGPWNSVGKPLPDYRVKIEDGDLYISGPGFYDAYANPWTPRQDEWFHTGDIAKLDEAGRVYLLSRKTAVINMAGRKVFPEEIEAVLLQHPAVQDCRVYGRAHPHLGELIEADVVPGQTGADPEQLRDHCRQHLAAYKVPTDIHLVPAVARTAVTGKLIRHG
ncbi:MAG: Long-chain-fatty-acid--CoA ligase [Verrucomicrobiae bacterium]|nr:Long-chain-fatty-acid--CoA ligase [Verrucomicrobiae bacterium]